MTTTVESVFGSGRTVGGFVLNNQLTDFSFAPTEDGRPVANAVHGGKRPRSSMAPIIVLDHAGNFVAALGSPGGSAILEYNAKTLVALLAWKLSLKQAIELPNLIARGDTFSGEIGRFTAGGARRSARARHRAQDRARGELRAARRSCATPTAPTRARPTRAARAWRACLPPPQQGAEARRRGLSAYAAGDAYARVRARSVRAGRPGEAQVVGAVPARPAAEHQVRVVAPADAAVVARERRRTSLCS